VKIGNYLFGDIKSIFDLSGMVFDFRRFFICFCVGFSVLFFSLSRSGLSELVVVYSLVFFLILSSIVFIIKVKKMVVVCRDIKYVVADWLVVLILLKMIYEKKNVSHNLEMLSLVLPNVFLFSLIEICPLMCSRVKDDYRELIENVFGVLEYEIGLSGMETPGVNESVSEINDLFMDLFRS
jgi:hypothetical protein